MILTREIATKKRVSARGRSVRTESGERKWQRSKTEANRVFYSCSCVHIRAFGLAGSLARGQDSRRNRYDSTSVGEETDKQWVGGAQGRYIHEKRDLGRCSRLAGVGFLPAKMLSTFILFQCMRSPCDPANVTERRTIRTIAWKNI